jgi:hypothetical protein
MTRQCVRTEVLISFRLGIRPFLYGFRLRLDQGTSCADDSEKYYFVGSR